MDRFRFAVALAIVLSIMIPAGSALAVKVYTTDTQELPLRVTPSSSGKTLLMVPPASDVELVNPHSYSKVRYQKPGGDVQEGWIATRFLSAWPPNSSIAKELGTENETLKTRLADLDRESAGLSQKEKELTDKLTRLNAAYEELKGGSANYLKLKTENDSAKASLASAQENIQTLVQENENLKVARDVRWVLTGVAVLLTGWLLGWASCKRKKKRGTYYY